MTERMVVMYKYWCRYRTAREWQVWRDSDGFADHSRGTRPRPRWSPRR